VTNIKSVGFPGVAIDEEKRPKAEAGDKEIDLSGHYVLPGFVDMHAHIGGHDQGTPAEYVYKLWMGHGITTIRDQEGDRPAGPARTGPLRIRPPLRYRDP